MKHLGLLRIFKRLRDVECRTRTLESVDVNAIASAVAARLIEEHDRKTGACAACSTQLDITKHREHGPMVMEKTIDGTLTRVFVCYECEPSANRNDWRRAQPTTAPAKPTLVPAPEQESVS
jgi:hypothetical protein